MLPRMLPWPRSTQRATSCVFKQLFRCLRHLRWRTLHQLPSASAPRRLPPRRSAGSAGRSAARSLRRLWRAQRQQSLLQPPTAELLPPLPPPPPPPLRTHRLYARSSSLACTRLHSRTAPPSRPRHCLRQTSSALRLSLLWPAAKQQCGHRRRCCSPRFRCSQCWRPSNHAALLRAANTCRCSWTRARPPMLSRIALRCGARRTTTAPLPPPMQLRASALRGRCAWPRCFLIVAMPAPAMP